MVRSSGSDGLAAGLEEVKRAPPNKKGKAKKEYPARITAGEIENPNPICVRDFEATDDAGDKDEAGRRMEPRNLSEPQGKAVYGIQVSA
jgi:hypothetical protein